MALCVSRYARQLLPGAAKWGGFARATGRGEVGIKQRGIIMTKTTLLKIDITDWVEEHDQAEPSITTEDDLIKLVTENKRTTAQAFRMATAARERGLAPADILPANKLILQTGGILNVNGLIARRMKEVQLANGSTTTVREFVAPVREEEEGHSVCDTQKISAPSPLLEFYVSTQSKEGNGRALDYLLKIVPGYIMGRLKIIAANGGDVAAAADALKAKIDEMVTRLG